MAEICVGVNTMQDIKYRGGRVVGGQESEEHSTTYG